MLARASSLVRGPSRRSIVESGKLKMQEPGTHERGARADMK
jgi:hypothetical protein